MKGQDERSQCYMTELSLGSCGSWFVSFNFTVGRILCTQRAQSSPVNYNDLTTSNHVREVGRPKLKFGNQLLVSNIFYQYIFFNLLANPILKKCQLNHFRFFDIFSPNIWDSQAFSFLSCAQLRFYEILFKLDLSINITI